MVSEGVTGDDSIRSIVYVRSEAIEPGIDNLPAAGNWRVAGESPATTFRIAKGGQVVMLTGSEKPALQTGRLRSSEQVPVRRRFFPP